MVPYTNSTGLTLGRSLCLYAYKGTLGLAGNIAEVGVLRGAGTLFVAKLFEPNSLTQVHGFDWFKGNQHPNPRLE